MMRLAKFIAQGGVCSRRQAEVLILQGHVKVNGELISLCAFNVNPDFDQVCVHDQLINKIEKTRIWCFYKPVGMITTHNDPQGRQTVFDYIQKTFNLPRVISVGRLDLNSEGLLLLTNDSNFSRMAELPSTKWPRVYKVRVFGDVDFKTFESLKKGCVVEGVRYDSINVEMLESSSSKSRNHWIIVTLYEGKNREIRKVMNYLGLQVNRLIRLSYGPFSLESLNPAQLREETAWKNLVLT